MKRTIYILAFLSQSFLFLLNAQTVVIDGEIRPRIEMRDGYSSPILSSTDPGMFTSQRTRIGLSFKSGILTSQLLLLR